MARMLARARRPAGRLPTVGRGYFPGKAAAAVLRRGPRAAARAGGRRRRVRRHQSLLRRFHGRLSGGRSRADSRDSARPEARRPRPTRIEKRPDEPRVDRLPRADLRRQRTASAGRRLRATGRAQRCAAVRAAAAGYLGAADRPYLRTTRTARRRRSARRPVPVSSANSTAPKRSRSCNRSTCSACRPCTANRKDCRRWRRWPTPCRSCCPTTAAFRKWSPTRAADSLCRPHDPADLADKLAELLRDPVRATSSASPASRPFKIATTPPAWPGKRSSCIAN